MMMLRLCAKIIIISFTNYGYGYYFRQSKPVLALTGLCFQALENLAPIWKLLKD